VKTFTAGATEEDCSTCQLFQTSSALMACAASPSSYGRLVCGLSASGDDWNNAPPLIHAFALLYRVLLLVSLLLILCRRTAAARAKHALEGAHGIAAAGDLPDTRASVRAPHPTSERTALSTRAGPVLDMIAPKPCAEEPSADELLSDMP
jgi:hypothetical protein